MFIVRVRNLIVKVDARYIRGMLNNPDIAPSASINRWIVSILTFHFELHHVPGRQHSPDGLSWHPPQPGDLSDSDDEDDFDNWVDNLYGFMHLINPLQLRSDSTKLLCTYAQVQTALCFTNNIGPDQSETTLEYRQVPCTETAVLADKRLEMAHDWLISFERPDNITQHEYALIIHYASGFFTDTNTLWKCDPQGAHK